MPKSLIPHSLLWLLFPYVLSFVPPCGLRGLLTQIPERESDWLPHHTELSPDWLTAIGSGGPLDQSALPNGARSRGTKAASELMRCGCGWSYPWPACCWGLWGGVREGGMTIRDWSLRFASVTSWAWQMFKVTSFLKRAFVGSSEAPFWCQLSFPPQGKSSPPSGCQCFPWQPWLSGDHVCVESRTGRINGSFLVRACLDHTWSRKSLCSFFPQCWHKHSFLPVSFFSLYLSSVDITSHACFQVCQAQGTQAKIKGESLEGPSLTLGRLWYGPMEYRSPN